MQEKNATRKGNWNYKHYILEQSYIIAPHRLLWIFALEFPQKFFLWKSLKLSFLELINIFCKSISNCRSCLKICGWTCIRKLLGLLNFSTVHVNYSIRWKLSAFYNSNNSYFCPFSNVFVFFVILVLDIKVRIKIEICNMLITTIAESVRDWINNTSVSRESIAPF